VDFLSLQLTLLRTGIQHRCRYDVNFHTDKNLPYHIQPIEKPTNQPTNKTEMTQTIQNTAHSKRSKATQTKSTPSNGPPSTNPSSVPAPATDASPSGTYLASGPNNPPKTPKTALPNYSFCTEVTRRIFRIFRGMPITIGVVPAFRMIMYCRFGVLRRRFTRMKRRRMT